MKCLHRSGWIVLPLLLLGLSCGGEKATERAIERQIEKASGGKAKVDLSKDKMTIKTKEGEMAISQSGAVDIPADFPKDVLVYKGAVVKMVFKQDKGVSMLLETADDVKKVAQAYQADMKANGWQEVGSMPMADGATLNYEKGKDNEKRNVIVGIGRGDDEGKTHITLTVAAEE